MIQEKANLNQNIPSKVNNVSDSTLLDTIVDSIQDIKGKKIVKMDLTMIEDTPANYFIVCQGESVTQMRAIIQSIQRRIKAELNIVPNHVEGNTVDAKWFLLDFFDIVVHVFYPETRDYYNLEDLWKDANITEYEDIL